MFQYCSSSIRVIRVGVRPCQEIRFTVRTDNQVTFSNSLEEYGQVKTFPTHTGIDCIRIASGIITDNLSVTRIFSRVVTGVINFTIPV